jgi:hypothetical protein
VQLGPKWTYEEWCEGIRAGRNYVGDGKSHLMEFTAQHAGDTVKMGVNGSELRLTQAGKVRATARVAARLNTAANPEIKNRPISQKPYWDIERARIGESREVAVELIVNGYPVAKKNIPADGRLQDVSFETNIERSSWVALRILPSSHTNPIFVVVGEEPIRASRRSAQWCLEGVDRCWSQKERFIKPAELEEAKAAYAHAREVYRQRLAESKLE